MNFKKVFISELSPAKYNPRKDLVSSDPEYQRIKRSIEEFGYVDPIIINSDYTVIGGHQRLKVMRELGHAQIDVVVVDIPKDKEKALNIALNKITGEWDTQRLTDLLGELKAEGMDISITGFDEKELETLLLDMDKLGDDFTLPTAEKEFTTLSFTLTNDQAVEIKTHLNLAKKEIGDTSESDNKNGNGNALYHVVKEWSAQRT